jgi:hypothetical protein
VLGACEVKAPGCPPHRVGEGGRGGQKEVGRLCFPLLGWESLLGEPSHQAVSRRPFLTILNAAQLAAMARGC